MSKIFGTLSTLELFDFHMTTLDVGLEIVGLLWISILIVVHLQLNMP